jgi:2'-5' RNA ligase
MPPEPTDPYADHASMTDHWWWRPGWQVGTRFYSWHLTLDGQDGLHHLADEYADQLASVSTLDLIPRQWRHITLQGLGHVAGVSEADRERAVSAVAGRLRQLDPITSAFQRAVVFAEAISLPPSNPAAFSELRGAIRAGIADAWGYTPEPAEGFRPHASIAYSNGPADGTAVRAALDAVAPAPAQAAIGSVSLIRMHRDDRMYEWETVAELPIGPHRSI